MTRRPSAIRGLGAAHDQQRRNILDAVFAIVDAQGVDQVSIRNVAGAAGVSVGRVQHYFPTKDALLSEAFAAINATGTERVSQRLADQETDDPESVIAVILTELIPDDDDRRRLVRVAQAFEVYALTRPELEKQVSQGYESLIDLIAGLLQPESDREGAAANASARELIALANGLGWMAVTGNIPADQARRIVIDRIGRAVAELGGRQAP